MTAEMTYRLDGYEFGTRAHDALILTGGLDQGTAEGRPQDVLNPVGDGSWFGRDYLNGPEISFKIAVNKTTGPDGLSALAALANAWRANDVRTTPGALSVLQWYRGGQWYRVYGRARKFAANPKEFTREQVQLVDCTFACAEPYVEYDAYQSLSTQLVAAPTDGGLVLPAVLPWELRPSSQSRQGIATVGGLSPAHFTVTVKGPTTGSLSKIRLWGQGWSWSITRSLAYDETLYVSTRTQQVLVNGVSMPGILSARDRLNVRLAPGVQTLGFDGADPSNTASATFGWRDTIPV